MIVLSSRVDWCSAESRWERKKLVKRREFIQRLIMPLRLSLELKIQRPPISHRP